MYLDEITLEKKYVPVLYRGAATESLEICDSVEKAEKKISDYAYRVFYGQEENFDYAKIEVTYTAFEVWKEEE